jgi:hypothetical protein
MLKRAEIETSAMVGVCEESRAGFVVDKDAVHALESYSTWRSYSICKRNRYSGRSWQLRRQDSKSVEFSPV